MPVTPVVAQRTGADLIGSESTHNIARGYGFPDDRFRTVTVGEPMKFGRFLLTAFPAQHSPGDIAPGRISEPLSTPARMKQFRTGDCYTLHVGHERTSLLIHASANFIPGALEGVQADTVYLGIGVLGKQTDQFLDQYWTETVTRTGARRVVLIHWDNFNRPLTRPLRPMPNASDDFARSMAYLLRRAAVDHVELALPRLAEAVDPTPSSSSR